MTFIVISIALLIERFFDWGHLRHWGWYAHLQKAVSQRVTEKSPYLVLGLTILPLLVAVLFLEYVFSGVLFGLIGFMFQLFILLYCLGPQNLWVDTYACMNAIAQDDPRVAEEKIQAAFGSTVVVPGQSLYAQLANQLFIAANKRIFALLFWFLILGPVGAVLYRLITLSAADSPQPSNARTAESILDWVPVRLFACLLALGGHCVQVLACWRKKAGLSLHLNEVLLTECGAAALGGDDIAQAAEDGSVTKNAISLLDRSFIIMLVVIAILSLII